FFGVSITKLTTGRLVNGLSCGGIDMVIKDLDLELKVDFRTSPYNEFMIQNETLLDVVGTSGCHCRVWQSFPMERIEQRNE
nr:hypothetical protein [Tanacetum cinerariifolium]